MSGRIHWGSGFDFPGLAVLMVGVLGSCTSQTTSAISRDSMSRSSPIQYSALSFNAFPYDSAAGVGDVDGDGYDDLLLRATLFFGHSDGVGGDRFQVLGDARRSTGLGDVNGDGYADIALAYPQTTGGAVEALLGGPGGLDLSRTVRVTNTGAESSFGSAVAGGGDLNGDGYDDLVVGAPGLDSEGGVFVYFGGPDGLLVSSELLIRSPWGRTRFGESLIILSDVHGDGLDDLVVLLDPEDEPVDLALVRVGKTGPTEMTRLGLPIDPERSALLANAGDLDGDGKGDLVVSDLPSERVYVVLGRSLTQKIVFEELVRPPVTWNQLFGDVIAGVGDVDGDGFGDLVVGAPADQWGSQGYEKCFYYGCFGSAFVYHGSAGGVDGTRIDALWSPHAGPFSDNDGYAYALGGAGDVNGDGFADVVVVATGADIAYVHHGPCLDTLFRDVDEDGFGDRYATITSCVDVEGYVNAPGDCDDGRADVWPGAPEKLDGIDNDCDHRVDEFLTTDDTDAPSTLTDSGGADTDVQGTTGPVTEKSGCGCVSTPGRDSLWVFPVWWLWVFRLRRGREL